MEKRGIIFDFDYTLGDSTEAIWQGFRKSFAELGYPEPEREAVRHTVGYTLEDGFTMLTGCGDADARERFHALFQQYGRPLMLDFTVLLPGAVELLSTLKQCEIPTAIVSTKRGETIRDILNHHGIPELVSFVVGAEDVTLCKPDPEGLLQAMDRLNLPKHALLFCGDTVIDAETALRGGIDFCAVLNGTTKREAFTPFPKRYIAENLLDLKQWLRI
ncbi:MAG: Phosphoglycolate phosphatase [Oscillospiraceae bacterium]|nr:Phosphoglycolate phosphatase [Oscillospiraceae bacterium]